MPEIPPPSNSTVDLDDDSEDSDLPKRFGKYTLIRKLAKGGMAELFLALQHSVAGFEKLIVIKRILPSMTEDRSFIEMLLHEARVVATLSHPNVVQVFDVGHVDGAYFIAMEHVHGEDIRSIVRRMKKTGVHEFPLEHAIAITLAVCAGLSYAHEKRDLNGTALNIVHRDISPQNIVVTFTGDVKVVDFGIATSDARLTDDTQPGKLKGKAPYMSPEQARDEPIDSRSDIFALGVILFELTTGKRLFKGQTELETLKLITERDYPPPSSVREGYPLELDRIVMRALAKDPGERFQSSREMQSALEQFVRSRRIPVSAIALSEFMQGLFGEKLARQKAALLQGKALADVLALHHERDSGEFEVGATSGTTSRPVAARMITEGRTLRKRDIGAVFLIAALLVVLGAGFAAAYFMTHRQPGPAVIPKPE